MRPFRTSSRERPRAPRRIPKERFWSDSALKMTPKGSQNDYFCLVKSMDSWILDINLPFKLMIFVFTENAYRPIGVEKIEIISFNEGIMTSANALLPR